jgi:hypothetical protein
VFAAVLMVGEVYHREKPRAATNGKLASADLDHAAAAAAATLLVVSHVFLHLGRHALEVNLLLPGSVVVLSVVADQPPAEIGCSKAALPNQIRACGVYVALAYQFHGVCEVGTRHVGSQGAPVIGAVSVPLFICQRLIALH